MIFFVKFRFFNSTSYLISISPWSCPMINNHLSQLWRICTRLCMFRIISSDGSRAGGYKRSEWSPDSQECEILPCLAAVKLPIKPKVNRKTWPFKYNILLEFIPNGKVRCSFPCIALLRSKNLGMMSSECNAVCIALHCSGAIFGMMSSECVAVCIALHCSGAKLHSWRLKF